MRTEPKDIESLNKSELHEASEKGNAEASFELASRYIQGGRENRAMKFLKETYGQLATQTSTSRHDKLTYFRDYYFSGNLFSGNLVKDKEQLSIFWATLVQVKNNNPQAQYDLAYFYRTINNNQKAVEHFMQAAAQEHVEAAFDLAVCYAFGTGVKEDKTSAVKFFLKAHKLDSKVIYSSSRQTTEEKSDKQEIPIKVADSRRQIIFSAYVKIFKDEINNCKQDLKICEELITIKSHQPLDEIQNKEVQSIEDGIDLLSDQIENHKKSIDNYRKRIKYLKEISSNLIIHERNLKFLLSYPLFKESGYILHYSNINYDSHKITTKQRVESKISENELTLWQSSPSALSRLKATIVQKKQKQKSNTILSEVDMTESKKTSSTSSNLVSLSILTTGDSSSSSTPSPSDPYPVHQSLANFPTASFIKPASLPPKPKEAASKDLPISNILELP